MGLQISQCCGIDDRFYEHINTTPRVKELEYRNALREKLASKLKSILYVKDPELSSYMNQIKNFEKLEALSINKEEIILELLAENELNRETIWDILLTIASKKYGDMELREEKKLDDKNINHRNNDSLLNGKSKQKPKKSNISSIAMDMKYDNENENNNKIYSNININHKQTTLMCSGRPSDVNFMSLSTLQRRIPSSKVWKMITPASLNELKSEMQFAVDNGKRIRAMGSRYGWTNITFTDGLLIDMFHSALNQPRLEVDESVLNEEGLQLSKYSKNLLLTEAGASVESITNCLWSKKRRLYLNDEKGHNYKMIPDLPGYGQISVGGLIQSGGYGIGTAYHYGSITNHVRSFSMLIIENNTDQKQKKNESSEMIVKLIQVEPSMDEGAIHDAYKWSIKYPNIQLIQNTDTFQSLLVSVGTCGVLYSLFFELMNAHFLYERRYIMNWKKFKHLQWPIIDRKCKNGDIVRLQFYLSPYLTYDKRFRESPPIVINTYEYTNELPIRSSHMLNTDTNVSINNGEKSNAKMKNRETVANTNNNTFNDHFNDYRSEECERATILAALLAVRFSITWPKIVPFILQMSLELTCHEGQVQPACNALSFGNINSIPTHKSAYAIHSQHFCELVADYNRMCNILRAKHAHQFITCPVVMRFSQPGIGFLNFTHGQSNVILEQSLIDFQNSIYMENNGVRHAIKKGSKHLKNDRIEIGTTPKLWSTLFKLQEVCMGDKYQGRSHLGMHSYVDENLWRNQEKYIKKFVEIYKQFNYHQLFCNQFTFDSGLDNMAGFVNLIEGKQVK